MKTDRWAYESLEVYVWEGKSDIADRVARFLSPLGVDVIRAGADHIHPERRQETRHTVGNVGLAFPYIDFKALVGPAICLHLSRAVRRLACCMA